MLGSSDFLILALTYACITVGTIFFFLLSDSNTVENHLLGMHFFFVEFLLRLKMFEFDIFSLTTRDNFFFLII